MEDEPALIQQARAGDASSLERLVELYAPQVLRFSRKLCENEHDAQDVVQQTLLSFASHLADFRGESKLSSWLFSIARSHCVKQRTRGAAAMPTESLDEPALKVPAVDQAPDEAVAHGEIAGALDAAIRRLEPAQREILVLRDVEGLSAPDVAEVLGISVEAVKSRLHRARKALRDDLSPWFEQSSASPSCPDVVDLLSRYQEGDVTSEACRALEAHVDGCPACAKRCHSLRSVLAACSLSPAPELPPALKQAVTAQIRRSLKRQTG